MHNAWHNIYDIYSVISLRPWRWNLNWRYFPDTFCVMFHPNSMPLIQDWKLSQETWGIRHGPRTACLKTERKKMFVTPEGFDRIHMHTWETLISHRHTGARLVITVAVTPAYSQQHISFSAWDVSWKIRAHTYEISDNEQSEIYVCAFGRLSTDRWCEGSPHPDSSVTPPVYIFLVLWSSGDSLF